MFFKMHTTPSAPPHLGPLAACWCLTIAANMAACVDPDARYDAFVEQKATLAETPRALPDAGLGTVPEPQQMVGKYLFSVSLAPYESEPTAYELDLEASKDGDSYSIRLRNRPLLFDDYQTPAGEWSEWTVSEVDDSGIFETPETVVNTPANANVLMLGTVANLVFTGNSSTAKYVGDDSSPVQFWCGHVTGKVSAAFITQQTQGTITAARIVEGDSYPRVTLNCEGELARPE